MPKVQQVSYSKGNSEEFIAGDKAHKCQIGISGQVSLEVFLWGRSIPLFLVSSVLGFKASFLQWLRTTSPVPQIYLSSATTLTLNAFLLKKALQLSHEMALKLYPRALSPHTRHVLCLNGFLLRREPRFPLEI